MNLLSHTLGKGLQGESLNCIIIVIKYRNGEAPLTLAMPMVEVLFRFFKGEVFMKMVFKQCILLSAVVLITGGCSEPIKSLPGIYEMNENTFTAYDETVLSGQQVNTALKLYNESLAIIVVKEGQNYVFGDNQAAIKAAGESQAMPLNDKEKVIDQEGTYESFILRDASNEVIGIKLKERREVR